MRAFGGFVNRSRMRPDDRTGAFARGLRRGFVTGYYPCRDGGVHEGGDICSFGFDLLQGWLVLAYILVGATLVLGGVNSGYLKALKAGVAETEGDQASDRLDQLLGSPRPLIVAALDFAIVAVIIWSMVYRPAF